MDVDIPALKAAALDRTNYVVDDDRVMAVPRATVLALIERLERAEQNAEASKMALDALNVSYLQQRARLAKLEVAAKAARDYKDNFYNNPSGRLFALLKQALAALEAP